MQLRPGELGREIEGPMAVVILGGLATSMVLNLLIFPTLALRYAWFAWTGRHQQNNKVSFDLSTSCRACA